MDFGDEFFKAFPIRLDTYCLIAKPYLSFNMEFNHQLNSTNLQLRTSFYQQQKEKAWNEQFTIETSNDKYPTSSISIIPFNYFTFNLFDDHYYLHLSPNKYSIFLRFIQDCTIKYGISYNTSPNSSIIGSFNLDDMIFLSAHFCEKHFSMFLKSLINDEVFYFGLKMNNRQSFFQSLYEIDAGASEIVKDGLFYVGYALAESFRISILRKKNNYRLTYILNAYLNSMFKIDNYIQYKYIIEKNRKFGFLYDFSNKTISMRGSIRLFKNFKIKSSLKFNGKFFDPTIGFSYNII